LHGYISAGTRITSSRYPRTGIKSGIRSMGDKTYPTAMAPNSFAGNGVLLVFHGDKNGWNIRF
jgi:hypothetical protein